MTEAVFQGRCPKGFPTDIFPVARRKLGMLDAAVTLDALRVPPANRLEALKKDRKGQYSIRINDQCPDSEVRIIVRRPRLRTSESTDTGNVLISCGFGSEVRISDSRQE